MVMPQAPLNVVFLDQATIPEHIHFRPLSFSNHWTSHQTTSAEELDQRLEGMQIVICNKVPLSANTLAKHPQIKLIAVSATGTNNIDLEYCKQHHIAVCNIQGYANRSVPEHVVAMIFALKRNLFAYHKDIQQGVWQQTGRFCFFTHSITDVAGSTLAIVGSGSLGRSVAQIAQALGMRVIFAERKDQTKIRDGYVSFNQALEQADIVTLHCPLTQATTNLIGVKELAKMKPSAILINTGRGGLVDEDALVEALNGGIIGGAGVDVFTQEPADESNPLLANMHLPNLILTPHVAWGSDSAIQSLVNILLDNIDDFVANKHTNRVV
jgi:glycerate dehydrogenase